MNFKTARLLLPVKDNIVSTIENVDIIKTDFSGVNVGIRKELWTREMVDRLLHALGQPSLEDLGFNQ